MNLMTQYWYLFIVFIAVMLSIFVFFLKQTRRTERHHTATEHDGLDILLEPKITSHEANEIRDVLQEDDADVLLNYAAVNAPQTIQSVARRAAKPVKNKQPELIVINLFAKNSEIFYGYELLQAVLGAGLRYGEMSIFHYYQTINGERKTLFSLASAFEPGVFDLEKIGAFQSKGLILFMSLQRHYHNIAAFETMLQIAYQLADEFDADLLDDRRNNLDANKIHEYRQRIQQYHNSSDE